MKVGIIGAGAVGSACLTALVSRGCAREIIVLNRDRKRARGLVTDVQYGAVLSPAVEVREGDYADLKGASLVMITAGVNEKTGGATDRNDPAGRLRLLDTNGWRTLDLDAGIRSYAGPRGSKRSSPPSTTPLTGNPNTGPWNRFQPQCSPMGSHRLLPVSAATPSRKPATTTPSVATSASDFIWPAD